VLERPPPAELAALGIDACGENGEFHTLATAGPFFRQPLAIMLGKQAKHSDCWFQDLSLAGSGYSIFQAVTPSSVATSNTA
jgi:diphthamide synthase (EF-2-diphthine--ammonia ligase)